MRKMNDFTKVLLLLVGSILLGVWIGLTYDKKEIQDTPSSIPPVPDDSKPMFYDFDSEVWEYVFSYDRANDNRDSGLTEEDLQKFLEKKVPNYLEDTYWGEEYDLDDKDY